MKKVGNRMKKLVFFEYLYLFGVTISTFHEHII